MSETRDRIVAAAMELFATQGYGRTRLAEIAKRCGARAGSVYYFFPTKEDLLLAVLDRRKELLWPEMLQPIWSRFDDPIDRLFGLLDGYRRTLLESNYSCGCPIGNLAIELTESHPQVRRGIAENFDAWHSAVAQCFRDASSRLPRDADPGELATFVLATIEGALMLARTYRDAKPFDAVAGRLRDYIDRLVAAGGGRPKPAANAASRPLTAGSR